MRPWTPVKIKIILINENEMTNKQEIWHSGLVNDYTINFIKFFNKQIKFLNKGVRFQTYLCQLNDFPSWAENRRSIFGGHISLDTTDIRHMSGICPHYVRSISFFGFELFCWKVYFESERVFFGFMER